MNSSFRWLLLLLLSSQIHFCTTAEHQKLPSIFFGKYTLEDSVNLDEYLAARGYKWLTRRLILVATVTKIIRESTSSIPLHYDMETLTWKKNVLYSNFTLGVPFLTHHLEDGLFNVTINMRPDEQIMTENIVRVGNPEDDETFEYSRDEDYLIMRTTWKGVNAVGIYRKICSYKANDYSETC